MISTSTLKFLKDLKKNNNREWFAEHKHEYEASKENVVAFVTEIIKQLSKTLPEYKVVIAAKTVARIYRDVRFSKNKDPYKSFICTNVRNFFTNFKTGDRSSPNVFIPHNQSTSCSSDPSTHSDCSH